MYNVESWLQPIIGGKRINEATGGFLDSAELSAQLWLGLERTNGLFMILLRALRSYMINRLM
ncbi:hypothetical protein AWM70_06250 [Paenibacillus yonginensis]|uniref:Uncharacterized protein n=1 Tax=Paenibacillus yonginensis TaxID=1462996 RepID=A0A1B1MYH4_9BACL|nr:hypothetical protein AWM70_06250 [Paenibacillus yonginensis]